MQKLFISLTHAWRGFIDLLKVEPNARIELGIAILFIGLGLWFKLSMMEWCFVFSCIGGVLAAEGLNTAIERLCDFQTRERNENIRFIKDVASGAVLIIGIMAIMIGLVIFGPKVYHLFG